MYTQFVVKYNKWARLTKATMRKTHKVLKKLNVAYVRNSVAEMPWKCS